MKLMLAEDDSVLADALITQLSGAGFEVEHAPNGAVADYLLERVVFDALVLDLGLPMVDGMVVLKRLREREPDLPVLVLSARDALDDRVGGFQAGADDYVTKPFDWPELSARLQALLRRRSRRSAAGPSQPVDHWAALHLEHERRRATVGDVVLELSGREWSLLTLLVEQRNRVVHKDTINQIWAGDQAEAGELGSGNTIEVYVHRLRRKLEGSGLVIRTVRGLGYLMEAAASP